MKKLLYIFIFFGLTSCNDGDIIVTSFEFEDVDLQLCQGAKPNEFVFFKINTSVNEAISYNFIDATYSVTTITENPIIIDLETPDNGLIYRKFNNTITADYYCNNIPDSSIIVTEELLSISGQATIINEIVSEDDNDGVESILEAPSEIDPEDDPDGDGVPNYLDDAMADSTIGNADQTADNLGIEDGYDTDGDQIPDFRDQDDDNDNVLTSVELPNSDPNDDSFLDTDEDGIPNYRDDDDDGDGILTKDEDINGNGNPRDDDTDGDGIANFLDTDDAISVTAESILSNTVITTFRTTLTVSDLILNEVNDQFTNDDFSFGFRDETVSITTPIN
ncbi:hypothetical protein [uncultured Aquimarina sp.]|uniref:hypothetical protein n=1 Tax=uncultured Aquimarina sp. TaxID=575652 RepID=UPI00262C7E50|nr:hypothetical protein [uncultured Aquimarina sp.]